MFSLEVAVSSLRIIVQVPSVNKQPYLKKFTFLYENTRNELRSN